MSLKIVNRKGNVFHARENFMSICNGCSLPSKPDEMPKVINQTSKTNALYVSGKDSILLQMAQIYIHAVDVEKIRARLLFHSGSQISFICQDIARHLKLPIVGQELLDVKVFGRNSTTSSA